MLMSEITKLYENAGIDYEERYNNCTLNKEGQCELKCSCDMCKYSEEKYIYPPFTAEKQLEILKLLIRHYKTEIYCRYANDKYKLIMYTEDCCTSDIGSFENVLASVVCNIWGLLSEEEKQQVKGILE